MTGYPTSMQPPRENYGELASASGEPPRENYGELASASGDPPRENYGKLASGTGEVLLLLQPFHGQAPFMGHVVMVWYKCGTAHARLT